MKHGSTGQQNVGLRTRGYVSGGVYEKQTIEKNLELHKILSINKQLVRVSDHVDLLLVFFFIYFY